VPRERVLFNGGSQKGKLEEPREGEKKQITVLQRKGELRVGQIFYNKKRKRIANKFFLERFSESESMEGKKV